MYLEFGAADGTNEVKFVMTRSHSTALGPVSWIRFGDVRVTLHT